MAVFSFLTSVKCSAKQPLNSRLAGGEKEENFSALSHPSKRRTHSRCHQYAYSKNLDRLQVQRDRIPSSFSIKGAERLERTHDRRKRAGIQNWEFRHRNSRFVDLLDRRSSDTLLLTMSMNRIYTLLSLTDDIITMIDWLGFVNFAVTSNVFLPFNTFVLKLICQSRVEKQREIITVFDESQ